MTDIPFGGIAYTLGCLSKQPDGSWKLTSIGIYSDKCPTCYLLRERYVELHPPVHGDDFHDARERARKAFVDFGHRELFAGVELQFDLEGL